MPAALQFVTDGARRIGRALLDLLLPPHCVACDVTVSAPGLLCADCFRQTGFITEPMCARCGVPFAAFGLGGSDMSGFADQPLGLRKCWLGDRMDMDNDDRDKRQEMKDKRNEPCASE